MTPKPYRIAILECDTPPPDVTAKFGRYDNIFKSVLETAAREMGMNPEKELETRGYDVVEKMEYPELEEVDGVLISGSSRFRPFHITSMIVRASLHS